MSGFTNSPTPMPLQIEGTSDTWVLTIPAGWEVVKIQSRILIHLRASDGLAALVSAARMDDGKVWIHGSVSRQNKMPDYQDMVRLKNLAFGPNRYAAQVMVPESKHVNIHNYCLHLWGPLYANEWPMPEFSKGGMI